MHFLLVLLLVSLASFARESEARGAGRAFPVHSENYAIDKFQRVNPSIEWDPTNYLVDKSGQFANCDQVKRGYEKIYDVTPEGNSIGAIFDHMSGDGVDVESVNFYIRTIIDGWMTSRQHDGTIRGADRFGCSVRPGCGGLVTVACLFSPAGDDDQQDKPEPFTQRGQAFTNEQYDVAEYITDKHWDRSHFLENLSGFEITCSMLERNDWTFAKSIKLAREYGMEVMGMNGEAPNLGSTQQAMEVILKRFKSIQTASKVGCSVIPDCTSGRGDLGDEMWVIVTCIYQELF